MRKKEAKEMKVTELFTEVFDDIDDEDFHEQAYVEMTQSSRREFKDLITKPLMFF